jgi:hypothetical protein
MTGLSGRPGNGPQLPTGRVQVAEPLARTGAELEQSAFAQHPWVTDGVRERAAYIQGRETIDIEFGRTENLCPAWLSGIEGQNVSRFNETSLGSPRFERDLSLSDGNSSISAVACID